LVTSEPSSADRARADQHAQAGLMCSTRTAYSRYSAANMT
jgi:hypothetical protein